MVRVRAEADRNKQRDHGHQKGCDHRSLRRSELDDRAARTRLHDGACRVGKAGRGHRGNGRVRSAGCEPGAQDRGRRSAP